MSEEMKQSDGANESGAGKLLTPEVQELFGNLGKNWGWMMALGILFIVMGVIALGMPMFVTLVTVIYFGALLLLGGVFQIIDAFKCKGWKGITWHVLIGLLYIAAAIIIFSDPALSSLTITAMLGGLIIAIGIFRIILGFQVKPDKGWGWLVFSGVVSILLGAIILARWPFSGLVVIGIMVGVEIIFHGWSYVFLSLAAKKARKDLTEARA
jgi:uncharacterized membrane protein HdeD (DUF308 family)